MEGIINTQPLTLEITMEITTLQNIRTIIKDGFSSHLKMVQLIIWQDMKRHGIGVRSAKGGEFIPLSSTQIINPSISQQLREIIAKES